MAKEIKRYGDDGMRTNNPDWTEARPIPDTLVEDTEIVRKEVRVQFYDKLRTIAPNPEYAEIIFKQGLMINAEEVTAVSFEETVVTTYRRSKV